MNDDQLIGFFSELEKEAYKVDEQSMNERLRVGSGPLWATGGALAGMAMGRKVLQEHGARAFWPLALFSALPAGLAAALLHRAMVGPQAEEREIAERALQRRPMGVLRGPAAA